MKKKKPKRRTTAKGLAQKKKAAGKKKPAAKKKANRSQAKRVSTLVGVKRCLAFAEIFRESRGWLSIKDLQDEATNTHPDVFDTEPSDDTVSRLVDLLLSVGVPITQSTAGAEGIEGSPKRLVWMHTPSESVLEGVTSLSGMTEKLDALIELAIAAEALAPYEGLSLYDTLLEMRQHFEDASGPHEKKKAERVAKQFRIASKKKAASSMPKVLVERRALLRTISECTREGVRLQISHKQQFAQPREQTWILEPRALNQRNGSLFLFAHCVYPLNQERYANLRQFKVTRISAAKKLSEPNSLEYRPADGQLTGRTAYAAQEPINLEEILASTIHDFLPPAHEQPLENIEITVDQQTANWVIEEKLHPRQKTSRTTTADGTPVLTVRIEKAFMSDIDKRLLGLASHVKVVRPPKLAEHLRRELQKAADQYVTDVVDAAGEGGKPPRPA